MKRSYLYTAPAVVSICYQHVPQTHFPGDPPWCYQHAYAIDLPLYLSNLITYLLQTFTQHGKQNC